MGKERTIQVELGDRIFDLLERIAVSLETISETINDSPDRYHESPPGELNENFDGANFDQIELFVVYRQHEHIEEDDLRELLETWDNTEVSVEWDDNYDHMADDEYLEFGDWDYDPVNPAHNPRENPWIDVFGPGEEAETAYWNTE